MNFELGKEYIVKVSEEGIIPIEEFRSDRFFDIESSDLDFLTDEEKTFVINDVLDKIRAEIAEYGSIMVAYAITEDTKTDKGIEKLVSDVLSETKRQVLDIIDKYKTESEE